MLEIKNLKKSYKTGTFTQKALDDVSIKFRTYEFVAVLGPSGSGKTTLLNILGGLDRYDSGDLIINGKSTTKFKNSDWDAYRNNSVGFIFQSYNLIGHISVLANVEMALTLSNVKNSIRRQKAIDALTKVGLKDHIYKRPNQLSGGQMQRVAIARSLVNDPDIILADEPTGALDSKTSVQIMDLIKSISRDKLVIMVTHNQDIAYKYATRVIELKDGQVKNDSNPLKEVENNNKNYQIKHTKMSFAEALHLSFTNIMTKKGRTLLTAFASSIGIIGIALILSLSNGFDKQIDKYEEGILSAMPIVISEQSMNMDEEDIAKLTGEDKEAYPDYDYIIPSKSTKDTLVRTNNITEDYVDYIENINPALVYGVSYNRYTNLNVLTKKDNKIESADLTNISIGTIPKSLSTDSDDNIMASYYDTLAGHLPENDNEMVLIVNSNNEVTTDILELLNLSTTENVTFTDILNTSIHVALNNDYYQKENGYYKVKSNLTASYKNSIELKVVGILRMNEDFPSYVQTASLAYTEAFMENYIEENSKSNIVVSQQNSDLNVLTGMPFTTTESTYSSSMTKDTFLAYLGSDSIPNTIMVYPKSFDTKDQLLEYLDAYNNDLADDDKILYTDEAEMISSMSGSIMSAITIVLIAFSSISLVVSSIMIGIITYISVLERTKEIGILRALGARRKDISRVFNAETFIIGITSGLIGIGIALLLTIPANIIIENLTDLKNVAILSPIHAVILIIVSMALTMIGGFIPAKMASKKDPVIALRTE